MTIISNPYNFILGIDPGLGGGLGLFDARSASDEIRLHQVFDIPTMRGITGKLVIDVVSLAELIGEINYDHEGTQAVIENVHGRPRQAGVFNFGFGVGVIHGILATHGVPFSLVTPSVWKSWMKLNRMGDETQDETKTRARLLAAKLFPTLSDKFKRVKDDGRAEALLLAYHFHAAPKKKG